MRLALTAARSILPRAVLLAFCLLNARCTHARTPPPATTEEASVTLTPIARQLDQLRSAFIEEVPAGNALSPERIAEVIAHGKAMMADNAILLDQPRLVIIIDRNPAAQDLVLALANPHGNWEVVGTTKVSTGQRGRFDHYITPTGVFLHTDAILGYRAEGTVNENGIRGLGIRGMRVWDFGWHNATKGWRNDGERGDIRLLMHATDPAGLEQRIGRPASQGCVRVPTALNKFLDRHGVLDADYERVAQTDARYRRLLRPDRTPSPFAGNAMIVVDSQEPP